MSTNIHKNKLLIGTALCATLLISAGIFFFQFREELFQSSIITSSGSTIALSKDKPLIGMYYYPGWNNESNAWNSTYNLKINNPEREYVTGWEDGGSEAFMDKEVTWAKDHGIDYIWLEQYEDPGAVPSFSTERRSYALQNFKKVNNNRLKFNLVWANHDTNTNGYSLEELARYASYWNTAYFSDPNYLKTPDGKNIIVLWSTGALKTNFTNSMKKLFADTLIAKAKAGTLNTALNGTSCGAYAASTAATWGNCLFTNQMTLIQSSHTDLASTEFSKETKACGAYPTGSNGTWTDCLVKTYFASLKSTYNTYIFLINDDFSAANLTRLKSLGADAGTGWSHFNVNIGGPALFTRYKETVASIYATLAKTTTPIPYFPTVQVSRNMEPWSYSSRTQFLDDTPAQFREVLELAGRFLIKKKNELPFQMLTIQSWNEMGEGGYLMPTKKWGFGKLEAVEDFKNCLYGITNSCSRTKEPTSGNQNAISNQNTNVHLSSNTNSISENQNTISSGNTNQIVENINTNTVPQNQNTVTSTNSNTSQQNANINSSNTNASGTQTNQNILTNANLNQNTQPISTNTNQPVLSNTNVNANPSLNTNTSLPVSVNTGNGAGGGYVVLPSQQNTNTSERPAAAQFTDIAGHFAQNFIQDLYAKGIIQGRTATHFEPNGTLNRAEAAKLIIVASRGEAPATQYLSGFTKTHPSYNYIWFPDVLVNTWYSKFVGLAKETNIISGTLSGKFEPSRNITRAEFTKMIVGTFFANTLKSSAPQNLPFKDVARTDWHAAYVQVALDNGLIDRNAEFRPNATITRGEAAKIISMALQKK